MHSPLLRAITSRGENLAAFRLLTKRLTKGATVFPDHLIEWRSRSCRRTIYWRGKNRIWAVLEPAKPDEEQSSMSCFWTCFGIGNPAQQETLKITVEINPPCSTGVGLTAFVNSSGRAYGKRYKPKTERGWPLSLAQSTT